MTLTRTIRRRDKRKRAKAAAAERAARLAAMSPEDRARLHRFSEMSDHCTSLMLNQLQNDLQALRFVASDRW